MDKGIFIVVYGPNNIGKTTQVKLLASDFFQRSRQILVFKYPIYSLDPTGPIINEALRLGNPRGLSEEQLQEFFARNRRDFQPVIKKILNAGISVLAEDYTGTGISWGMTRGIPLEKLEAINSGLLEPDISILLDGDRFPDGHEKGHRNEDVPVAVWEKNRKIHLRLAKRYGWILVNANQTISKVHKDILKAAGQV